MRKVKQIKLFTASACPMGRTMGTVLREVGEHEPELSITTYYIDIHIEETNHYRIKQNPTVLLVSENDQEVYRVVGFKETEEIIQILDQIDLNQLSADVYLKENEESIEKYVFYLFKEESLVPVEVEYRNLTSVKTPRITLIQLLLEGNISGLTNPFPPGSSLELVQFNENKGIISLKGLQQVTTHDLLKMRRVLEKSLESFNIQKIEITSL